MAHRISLSVALLLLAGGTAIAQTLTTQTLPTLTPPQSGAPVPVVRPPPGAHPSKPRHPHPAKPPTAHVAAPAPPAPATPPTPPAAAGAAPEKPDPTKGSSTGLPLPRWVAFRSDEVNLRSGPGMQYPIDWQYHRRDLPVRILREFEVWRLIETEDGAKDWVHQATLTGRRGFIVTDAERVLRATADDGAAAVAKLEPGVVGTLRSCEAGKPWCEVQTGEYRGFLRRSEFWGVDPDEAVN